MATLAALAALIAAPVWGLLSDQVVGARAALVGAAALAAVCALAVGLTEVAVLAALVAILYQLAFAGVAPVLDAYALDQVGADQHRYSRLRVWGSASFVVSVGRRRPARSSRCRSGRMFVVLIGCLIAAALVAALRPATHHGSRATQLLGVARRASHTRPHDVRGRRARRLERLDDGQRLLLDLPGFAEHAGRPCRQRLGARRGRRGAD